MASVEDRIVRMEFDNSSFERKISETITSLAHLEKALKIEDAGKGINAATQAARGFDGSHMASALENISSKFSALGAIGFTVIQGLTRSAMGMAKSLGQDILEPIIGGGKKRATNIENAKFQFKGLGIDVDKAMASSLKAVKGTAFGLDEAAKAAAQFGASGIDAGDDMTSALRAIAGSAAMTNTSFSEMADIFTSSAGSGVVNNQDLGQFATRGLNAAAAVAKVMGKTEAEVHKMAREGKLDFKTFSDAMDQAFGKHATEANKTYTGALANMRAALARVGESFFTPRMEQQRDLFNALTPVIDNLNDALKPLFNTLLGFTGMGNSKLIESLKNLNLDRLKLAIVIVSQGLVSAFKMFGQVIDVVKKAFRDIFPKSSESMLVNLALLFKKVTDAMIMGGDTIGKLRRIFDGFFSILKIGWTILKEGVKFVAGLVSQFTNLGSGNILETFAKLGDVFTNLQKSLVKGGGITKFFQSLTKFVKEPVPYIKALAKHIADFFTHLNPGVADNLGVGLGRLGQRFKTLGRIVGAMKNVWDRFSVVLHGVTKILDEIWQVIKDWFKDLGKKMAAVLGPGEFNDVLDALNVSLLGGIALLISKWMKTPMTLHIGIFDKIGGVLDAVTEKLKVMQLEIKAKALMKIAEAIAVLTASIVVLSLVDSAALTRSLTAMAVGFGQLVATFAALDKVGGDKKAGKMTVLATGLILIASAVLIVSLAVRALAKLDPKELATGLSAVTGVLGAMIATARLLKDNTDGIIAASLGMIGMALALTILAGAVKLFSLMSYTEIGKGLASIGLGLLIIAGTMHLMPEHMESKGLTLIGIAIALNILAEAVKKFGSMNWKELAKGLAGVGLGLLVIAGGMHLMPAEEMLANAAGLLLVAVALTIIGDAMKKFASMSWGELAKGLIAMGIAMILIGAVTTSMTDALPGAAAMIVVAFALQILADVLIKVAQVPFGDLMKAIGGLVIAMLAFGLVALVLEEVVPAMLGLGAALLLVGAAFALFGVGAFLAAKAFKIFVDAGPKGAEAVTKALEALGKALPSLVKGFAEGIVELMMVFIKAAPVISKLLNVLVNSILDTLIKAVPKLGILIKELISTVIDIVGEKVPDLIQAGYDILIAFLSGIRDNIGDIVEVVADIITNFLDALTEKVPEVAQSFFDFVVAVVDAVYLKGAELALRTSPIGVVLSTGLFDGIRQKAKDIAAWFGELGGKVVLWIGAIGRVLVPKGIDFIAGLWTGITDRIKGVTTFFQNLRKAISGWIGDTGRTLLAKGVSFIAGLWTGITDRINGVRTWFQNLRSSISTWLGDTGGTLKAKGAAFLGGMLAGIIEAVVGVKNWFTNLRQSVYNWVGDLSHTLTNVGGSLIRGMLDGIQSAWHTMTGWMSDAASHLPGIIKGPLGIHSPSTVMMVVGNQVMDGFDIGMKKTWSSTTGWLEGLDVAGHVDGAGMGSRLQTAITSALQSVEELDEFQVVITPVLDLTDFETEAKKMRRYLMAMNRMSATFSNGQANAIASGRPSRQDSTADESAKAAADVKFEQNIYAPSELSTSDIYKQTRNQIAMAKEELSIR